MQPAPGADEIQSLVSLFKQGRLAELEPLAASFSRTYPAHGLGWMLLGAIYKADKRHLEALWAQFKAIEVMPPKAELYSNLGNIQFALEQYADAEANYSKCLSLDASHVPGHYNYGLLLLQTHRPRQAEVQFRHALRLGAATADLLYQTALAVLDQGQFSRSIDLLQQAIAMRPDYAQAHDSLSFAYLNLGRLDQAVQEGAAAAACSPDDCAVLGNLLFTSNYSSNENSTALLARARTYGELVTRKAGPHRFTSWIARADPGKLRIGFVSGDFKEHPVSFFLQGLIDTIDRSRFELLAYSTVRFEDDYTRKIRSQVRTFRVLPPDDEQAARQIHDDGVHILIDLAGHTGHGRLPVFAFRPAPVQASWLGYFATTGVPQMDYLLADQVAVPGPEQDRFTEAICYLPRTRLCFTPAERAPAVKPPPALKNKFVTIGCYQNVAKVNDDVLDCWKPVFQAMPKARLRWQCAQFSDLDVRKAMAARLSRRGIGASRVQLLKSTSRLDYLESHGSVDLILDTFPFPGGTTTCEALWMGVPTLTLAGRTLLSRQGASMLTAAGLPDWIAGDTAQYQQKALRFAGDLDALAQLRMRMRPMLESTPLFDRAGFARNFERTMQELWSRHEHTNRERHLRPDRGAG